MRKSQALQKASVIAAFAIFSLPMHSQQAGPPPPAAASPQVGWSRDSLRRRRAHGPRVWCTG